MPTTSYTLTDPGLWVDLGATPCSLQSLGPNRVTFVVDVQAPATAATVGFVLSAEDRSADISFASQRVYARLLEIAGSYQGAPATVVVAR